MIMWLCIYWMWKHVSYNVYNCMVIKCSCCVYSLLSAPKWTKYLLTQLQWLLVFSEHFTFENFYSMKKSLVKKKEKKSLIILT